MASEKWMVTGEHPRATDSYPIRTAIIARMMALGKPAKSPSFPVPKLNRVSSACLREPAGHECAGAKHKAADDLGSHHCPTEPDHGPGLAFALLMSRLEEDVGMIRKKLLCGCFGYADHLR